jgi:hypothetical protein
MLEVNVIVAVEFTFNLAQLEPLRFVTVIGSVPYAVLK